MGKGHKNGNNAFYKRVNRNGTREQRREQKNAIGLVTASKMHRKDAKQHVINGNYCFECNEHHNGRKRKGLCLIYPKHMAQDPYSRRKWMSEQLDKETSMVKMGLLKLVVIESRGDEE